MSEVTFIWSHQCGPACTGVGVATGAAAVGAMKGERIAIGS